MDLDINTAASLLTAIINLVTVIIQLIIAVEAFTGRRK